MAWSSPVTAVANAALTAAQWNASVRDNLNETAVAKATASGRTIVTAGANSLAERVPTAGYIGTSETTTSTTYAHLATIGPDVLSLTTGPLALVVFGAHMSNSTVNAEAYVGLQISGATTDNPNDPESARHTSATANASVGCSLAYLFPLTAGVNNFRLQYRVSSGTGTYQYRRLSVLPF